MTLYEALKIKKNEFKMPEIDLKHLIPEENPLKLSNIKEWINRKKLKLDEEEKEKD